MSENSTSDEQAGKSDPAEKENDKSAAKAARPGEHRKVHAEPGTDKEVAGRSPSVDAGNGEAGYGRRSRGASGVVSVLALLVALAAAGFAAWQGYELQRKSRQLDSEVASQLDKIESIGSDSRRLSGEARDIAQDVEARLGQLDARLAGIETQRRAMESLYEDLSGSRDEWTIAEVEQILLVASQQLQLAANVKAAVTALEAADARLARSDRPQFTQLRRVIEDDIERLKSSPFVDVTGIGLKLERAIGSVDSLPLAMETRPAAVNGETADTSAGGWRALMAEVWNDLSSLVRIERINAAEPPLLAPDQAYFLKENLKLRLLSARLALLARDQEAYKADLEAATAWLGRYFDVNVPAVASSISTLNELAESDVVIQLPDVSASLKAVRKYRLLDQRNGR